MISLQLVFFAELSAELEAWGKWWSGMLHVLFMLIYLGLMEDDFHDVITSNIFA